MVTIWTVSVLFCEKFVAEYGLLGLRRNMVKHISVRFAWHDKKWNGEICHDPLGNTYCRGNYSLLSPRIQKRIDLELETNDFHDKPVSEVIGKGYLPPCYWSINAFGNSTTKIEDKHPFESIKKFSNPFATRVPPLKLELSNHSIFTWCFKLGFSESQAQRYVPPEELERRTESYVSEIVPKKSISFLYANYSNPLTDDDHDYLLLGAALATSAESCGKYEIPPDLLQSIRSQWGMRNLSERAWEIKLNLDSQNSFVLPYHEYLDWMKATPGVQKNPKWKQLEEVTVPIVAKNLIPHFKYVSMHLNHDKAIYLLYLLRNSILKMKEQDIPNVNPDELTRCLAVVDNLLRIAWQERGQFPGFENAAATFLSDRFQNEELDQVLYGVRKQIIHELSSMDNFLNGSKSVAVGKMDPRTATALKILESNKALLTFLSLFDLSRPQFKNLRGIIATLGLPTAKENPYLLLERYYSDEQYSWDIDESDYGLDLYQFDIALIPDLNPTYGVSWSTEYHASSPGRIRAVISKILSDAALEDGDTYLEREEIIERVSKYPLFYLKEALNLDADRLAEFERLALFKEKFEIKDNETFRGVPISYQLKEILDIDKAIEFFLDKMIKKKYNLSGQDKIDIDRMVVDDKELFKGKSIDTTERYNMYANVLQNGLFIISGKAGSGKTSAIVRLVQKFRAEQHLPIYIFAPTGKASLVIRDRLKKNNLLGDEKTLKVSTIHRFLYAALFDHIRSMKFRSHGQSYGVSREVTSMAVKFVDLVERVLSGDFGSLKEFQRMASMLRFTPSIVIIDEASMVDEMLLSALLSMLNPETLRHLVIVGDERQLPPIGMGRPFVDTIFNLKKKGMVDNYVRLDADLRFDDPNARLGALAGIFGEQREPLTEDIDTAIRANDATFELSFFKNYDEIKEGIKRVLRVIGSPKPGGLSDMFGDIFEEKLDKLNLDKIQIITPRRSGDFGTWTINANVVRDGIVNFGPRTKLICEENQYVYVKVDDREKRVLALANGSVGYVKQDEDVYFPELEDFRKEYGQDPNIGSILREISDDTLQIERSINFGYALTVHKAQGSDYEYVILVVPEVGPFNVRELLYTAFTRTRKKLFLMVHEELKDALPQVLHDVHKNSEIVYRKTMLYGYKKKVEKPYLLTLKNGSQEEFRSQIECRIAENLDQLGVAFRYEPEEFYLQHGMKPDFLIEVDGETFYLEHLGNMNNPNYRNRNLNKLKKYKNLGLEDRVVTTSLKSYNSNLREGLETILEHMKKRELKKTEGDYWIYNYLL